MAKVHRQENQKPTLRETDRTLGKRYEHDAYRRAVIRACAKAIEAAVAEKSRKPNR